MPGSPDRRLSLEILPQLREKYPRCLRPEIISVRFTQSADRCYLEITTAEQVAGYLVDEVTKRADLAFIAGEEATDDQFFSPTRPITENAHRFITDLDEVSVINCTDLFTPEAAMRRIDDYWRRYGRVPSPA